MFGQDPDLYKQGSENNLARKVNRISEKVQIWGLAFCRIQINMEQMPMADLIP